MESLFGVKYFLSFKNHGKRGIFTHFFAIQVLFRFKLVRFICKVCVAEDEIDAALLKCCVARFGGEVVVLPATNRQREKDQWYYFGVEDMRILVIEDNARLRKSLVDYLSDEGYAVDAAADGKDGLARLIRLNYDLLILDVMLPLVDGWAVLKRLRTSNRSLPVIMLTARDSLDDRLKGLDGGADDYLVKPFEMQELLARIRAALRRAGRAPNPVVQVGPITLDMNRRTASVDGLPVELTTQEYNLLEVFIRRQNQVLTREFLYDYLFDTRDESVSNTLDVYIYKLRQKFGKHLIQTRRGMGYLFSADAS